jgi:hypothetical protein
MNIATRHCLGIMTSVTAAREALQEIRVKQQSLELEDRWNSNLDDLWIQHQRQNASLLDRWRLAYAEREALEQAARKTLEQAARETLEQAAREQRELLEQVAREQLELLEKAVREQLEQAARDQLEQAAREQLEHERITHLWRCLEYLALLLLSILRFLLSCSKFGGFQNRERPRCTTMPWNIWPSLVVLWGVCWMFINTPFIEFDATQFNSAFDDEQLPLFVPSKTFPSTREISQMH